MYVALKDIPAGKKRILKGSSLKTDELALTTQLVLLDQGFIAWKGEGPSPIDEMRGHYVTGMRAGRKELSKPILTKMPKADVEEVMGMHSPNFQKEPEFTVNGKPAPEIPVQAAVKVDVKIAPNTCDVCGKPHTSQKNLKTHKTLAHKPK